MKILIAEDDVYTRSGLIEILENEGFSVVAASSGAEAVELYNTEKPDFLCLDIMMPEMNGYDVCRKIRSNDENIPVLFLSAKSEEIDKVVGLELGADDYIVKPFGVRELIARINSIYRRYEKAGDSRMTGDPSAQFSIGDIIVEPHELRGYRGNHEIELTKREVTVLSHFSKNRGKVISRNELFDAGWGVEYLPSSRSLDQFISQLRKKIETNPKRPEIIVTVHTAGYRYP